MESSLYPIKTLLKSNNSEFMKNFASGKYWYCSNYMFPFNTIKTDKNQLNKALNQSDSNYNNSSGSNSSKTCPVLKPLTF